MSLLDRRKVCEVCGVERAYPADFHPDACWSSDTCIICFGRFVADCLEDWQRRQAWDNEIIGGYRRVELAYHDEYYYGGPGECQRCGDSAGFDSGGHRDYIRLPGGQEWTVCYECYRAWARAADVDGDGDEFMSPAAVARFQWSGVEGQQAQRERQRLERKAVAERQGGVCADCGFKPVGHLDYLVAWPREQPDGFQMICQPCNKRRKETAAG